MLCDRYDLENAMANYIIRQVLNFLTEERKKKCPRSKSLRLLVYGRKIE